MQGIGQTLDNRFVRFGGGGGGWHHNAAGHPDELNHPETAHLHVTDAAHGAFADVQQDHSIAVDPKVIPGRSRVYIESSDGSRVIGERHADDTGGGIRGYHIDHFSGAGSAASPCSRDSFAPSHSARSSGLSAVEISPLGKISYSSFALLKRSVDEHPFGMTALRRN